MLNEAIAYVKDTSKYQRCLPTLDLDSLRETVICDSSLANLDGGKATQGGRLVCLSDKHGRHNVTLARSGKLKRVVHSSFDGETVVAVDAVSDGMGTNLLVCRL